VLLEQDERRVLVTTASAGTPADDPAGGLGGRGAHAAAALTSRKPILTALDGGEVGAPGAAVGAALFEPVLRDGEAVGVLAFMWPLRPSQVSDDAIVAAHLLAGETASLLARSDRLETLRRLAHQDGLTGLPNRRMWEEHLPREMARARRDSTPLCVALIDLDEFKAYNDRHGHQAGDRLLRDAASEWRSRLRASDVIARYGGEEFGVLLPGCDLPAALDLLERIRTATPAPATCSIGVAVWDGGETARELLDRADRALYAAKRAGRDRTMLAAVGDRDAAPAGHSAGA
jgi:diguanylate cyclase (GGDEF)-like protein